MHRKKLITKLAIPTGIIALISLVVILLQYPYRNMEFNNHKKKFDTYYKQFSSGNKDYLQNIAKSINSVPVSNKVINSLQSAYFVDHQKYDAPKKYLWMSSLNDEFLFGVPKDDFASLNTAYTKYQDVIKSDDSYKSRNDFFTKLIEKYREVDFSQFVRGERVDRYYYNGNWRFFNNEADWDFMQPTATTFSTPVYDEKGNMIGELFMKVDDGVNEKYYYSKRRLEDSDLFSVLNVVFGLFLGFSTAFLWFLLPTWVYTDAQERDMRNPGVWAFLSLISLFFGLTIYLITRPNTYRSLHCPTCQGELNGTRAYCPHCGTDLSANFCQQCQYPIKPEWQFCPNCRAETKTKMLLKTEERKHSEMI
ncbi:MAG: zinc ribbon domain-containing protein [bacterium]